MTVPRVRGSPPKGKALRCMAPCAIFGIVEDCGRYTKLRDRILTLHRRLQSRDSLSELRRFVSISLRCGHYSSMIINRDPPSLQTLPVSIPQS